jgi:hypothetical protein
MLLTPYALHNCGLFRKHAIFRGGYQEQRNTQKIEMVKLENTETTRFQVAVSLKWFMLNVFVVILSENARQSAFPFSLLT